jgi:hypothetical protein
MFCEGENCGAMIRHDDQFRGVSHGYVDHRSGAAFRFVSPDYFRLVPWEGEGLRPVGYGYDSIEANVSAAIRVNAAATGRSGSDALSRQQQVLEEIDRRGIIATPGNSFINELVTEAARLSIATSGRRAVIDYSATPAARLGD